MHRVILPSAAVIAALCLLTACGGGSSGSTTSGGGGGGSPAPLGAPAIVTVASGQDLTGINISAASPTGTAPNAEDLGVSASLSGATAANTGATIARGSTMTVLLFGPGLSGSMQVSILGPADIAVSGVQGISATDGTPGVAFTAAVAADAALGGRTIVLEDGSQNVTTFTGGLEVVP